MYVAALVVIILIGNIILKSVAEKKIRSSLNQFVPYIKADFSKMHVNLLSATVSLDNLTIFYQPEPKVQQHKHTAYFASVSITGINFFKLISGKEFLCR